MLGERETHIVQEWAWQLFVFLFNVKKIKLQIYK